jgi:lipid kinase YegS
VRVTLVVNTADTGAIEALRRHVEALRQAGSTVRPRVTFEAGDARVFAREAAEEGHDLVVAAGGDGTVNEVVNGLYDWLDEAGYAPDALPRLAVVPLGTGNDLAGALGIPGSVDEAMGVAVDGLAAPLDVAAVNGRRFLNVSTGGFGAAATDDAPTQAKRILGPFAYVLTALRTFATHPTTSARFTAGGEVLYEGAFLAFAVGNTWRTGGGTRITALAEPDDGLLDLCIVQEMGALESLALAPRVRAGTHLDHPGVLYQQVRTVRVDSAEDLRVNADGEPVDGREFRYEILPRRLRVMVPQPSPDAEPAGLGDPDRAG